MEDKEKVGVSSMRLKIILFVSLLAICGGADALTFVQEISVQGDGNLSAKTTTDAAKDAVVGTGEQSYKRELGLQEGATTLTSKYQLVSSQRGTNNRYFTQMNSLAGLEHSVTVTSFSDIDSESSIAQSEYEVDTSYNIDAKDGVMSESITDLQDLSKDKTGHKLVETFIEGSFLVKSEFYDDGGVKKLMGFSPEALLNQLDAVEMGGAIATSDGSIEFLYGELESNVEVEIGKGVIPLGKRTKYYQSKEEYIGGRKIIFLGDRPSIS